MCQEERAFPTEPLLVVRKTAMFSDKMPTATASVSEQVREAIRSSEVRVFTTRDVLSSVPGATRQLVDQVVSRMVRAGELERVARGLFSKPKTNRIIGRLSPDPREVVAAVERAGMPVIPSGVYALNALHLSTQVPAKPEFLTAGPTRTIFIRNLPIRLKHVSVRRFRVKNYVVQLIIEALRMLGRDRITDKDINAINSTITDSDREALCNHIGEAPIWMQPYLRKIVFVEV